MPLVELEPLPLEPIFVERVWGGKGLAASFGKDLPPDRPIGESWEASDVGDRVSRVSAGTYAGRTVRELVGRYGERLTGSVPLPEGRLPLLFKLIDAREDLSVQLHPRYDELPPGSEARGKEEAWYVLAADEGARLVHGLKPEVTAGKLYEAIAANKPEECLQWYPVSPGEVYYVPPGTVHAIGGGIILAEIQQSSDTTYRLYDWGRVGLDGKPRQLHIDEAKRVTLATPVPCPYTPEAEAKEATDPDLLVSGEHFLLWRYGLAAGRTAQGLLETHFAFLFTVKGRARLETHLGTWTLQRGQTWLFPARLGPWTITSEEAWTALWMEPIPTE